MISWKATNSIYTLTVLNFDLTSRMKHKSNIDEEFLEKAVSDFVYSHQRILELGKTEETDIFFQTNEMLGILSKIFIKAGNFMDTMDSSKCSMHVYGQYLLVRSEKMNITFDWGVEHDYFYLESYLGHADKLRYMDDEFYRSLLELKALKNFEYRLNGTLSKDQKPYYENKTSLIFGLIRNYMLHQDEKLNSEDFRLRASFDPGNLSVKFPFELGWDAIIREAGHAFKLMYRLNYLLWKAPSYS